MGTTALVIAILVKAPTHQSGSFVFATFVDQTGVDGVGWGVSNKDLLKGTQNSHIVSIGIQERASHAYVVVIGILMAQYTLTGFDG